MICDHHEGSAVQEPSPYSRTYFSGLYCLLSTTLEFAACGGGWMVFQKLSTKCAGSGVPRRCRQSQMPSVLCLDPPNMSNK